MRRGGFTLVEIVCAVVLVGVVTTVAIATFNAVSRGWEISTDYIDKLQRTDYALNQVVASLRSMYYPADDEQTYDHGFMLTDNGEGEDPARSDVIEWSRLASIGDRDRNSASTHRVQLMVLEEGSAEYGRNGEIGATGLYMRQRPDPGIQPKDGDDDEDCTFGNKELYEPMLVAAGIVGFNCRVLKEEPAQTDSKASYEKDDFEDTWDSSNSVPYKVELTFRIADPEGRSYRTNTAPVMRIVRIPMYEQSQDGAATPSAVEDNVKGKGGGKRSGGKQK